MYPTLKIYAHNPFYCSHSNAQTFSHISVINNLYHRGFEINIHYKFFLCQQMLTTQTSTLEYNILSYCGE